MQNRRLLKWLFYGHVWIALAATSLSWLSLRLAYGHQDCIAEWPVLMFSFFSTLGVYTFHRYLSFQRAGERPTTRRYEIVARHPNVSLLVGGTSLLIAGVMCISFLKTIWPALLLALPVTVFYLTPPAKGWPRLRDLPYMKNIFVALAWTIMTAVVPVWVVEAQADYFRVEYTNDLMGLISLFSCGIDPLSYPNFYLDLLTRFLFTACIALLFDLRDVPLDRSQGVRTVAGEKPGLHRQLVDIGLLCCGALSLFTTHNGCIYPGPETSLCVAYVLALAAAHFTYPKTDEDWFAVAVNGLLLLPPVLYFIAGFLGGNAGAMGGF